MWIKTQGGRLVNLAGATQVFCHGDRGGVRLAAGIGPGARGIGHLTLARFAGRDEADAAVTEIAAALIMGGVFLDLAELYPVPAAAAAGDAADASPEDPNF